MVAVELNWSAPVGTKAVSVAATRDNVVKLRPASTDGTMWQGSVEARSVDREIIMSPPPLVLFALRRSRSSLSPQRMPSSHVCCHVRRSPPTSSHPQVPAGVETTLEVFEGRHTFTVGPLQVFAPVTVNAGRLAALPEELPQEERMA